MTTSLTSQHAWKLWHEALSALVRAEGQDLSTRQMANLPHGYIAPLLEMLRRPADIPCILNLAAILVMDTLNHTKFMRRKRALADRIPRQEDAAKNVKCPSLLVRGGLSDVLSEEGAQAYLSLVPHSEYANVGEAAHMVAGDRNDVFVAAVLEFLSKVAPPT